MTDWNRITRTHFSTRTIEALQSVSQQLPERGVIINIGSYLEASTISLLYGRPDLMAFSIDVRFIEDGQHNLEAFEVAKQVTYIWGQSHEVGRHWPGKVDCIYVDGNHSYEGCKRDIVTWLPHLKVGGFMIFHDYLTPHCIGVTDTVNELIDGQLEYVGSDGWRNVDTLRMFRK